MNDSNSTTPTPTPDVIDNFFDKLGEEAVAAGYSADLIKNMRKSPEMMDIIMRMIGAELKAIKAERSATRSI